MKIRSGTYTNINGSMYRIEDARSEVPSKSEILLLAEDAGSINLNEFTLSNDGHTYWKKIDATALTNACQVRTLGIYHTINVEVFPKPNDALVIIGTSNHEDAVKADLVKIADGWYVQDIPIKSLTKIWEAYSPSKYDLPIPLGLPSSREIVID